MAQGLEGGNRFPHLSLPLIVRDRARLPPGGGEAVQEKENKSNRLQHSNQLKAAAGRAVAAWSELRQMREREQLPPIPPNIPLFIKVEPDSDLEYLRKYFKLEIVSEQDDGFVVVASEEIDMATFVEKVEGFAEGIRGTATAAKIYEVIGPENTKVRLERLLSEHLREKWQEIADDQIYTFEVGIECLGTVVLPDPPEQKAGESDAHFEERLAVWKEKQRQAQAAWDDLMIEREEGVIEFVSGYGGAILDIVHNAHVGAAEFPDSFTVRIRMSGLGMRDMVLNYPYLFEVNEPEEVQTVIRGAGGAVEEAYQLDIQPPGANAATVCVIDSGIQEQHPLLANVMDRPASLCLIPGSDETDVGDYVPGGGHGTRVAGAVIYPRSVPRIGEFNASCWIQNARVLDGNNALAEELYPPSYVRAIVERYHNGARRTKIFNHSIAAYRPCRLRHMSAWAAAIDLLSWEYDVLFIQAAGNLPDSSAALPVRYGILDHLHAGRNYPDYLVRGSSRISSPAESLQAITVGSINHLSYVQGHLRSFGETDQTSSFSTTGLGVWGSIKPEVVEYGGDLVYDGNHPPSLTTPSDVCPELVRSTMHGGPLVAKDEIGTSFAAPKVASIAAALQNLLPDETALLYRGLIINSARWPEWAEGARNKLEALRQIGYGIPSVDRATSNTPFRVTLITSGDNRVRAKEAHVYQIPIPPELRAPGDDFNIRIDVTLSYVARPRRTRRNARKYLSTWVDWRSSRLGESVESFKNRVLKDGDINNKDGENAIPWVIRERDDWGEIEGVKRSTGTVQKDWVVISSHELPRDFCIAVVGHAGWDKDPDAHAKYALTVSFEAINQDLEIYDRIESSINTLVHVPEIEQVIGAP